MLASSAEYRSRPTSARLEWRHRLCSSMEEQFRPKERVGGSSPSRGTCSYTRTMAPSAQRSIADIMSALDEDARKQVQLLRDIIASLEVDLTEHVKWNAPSYVLHGEDRITMNLRNKQGLVKLVLHMGATRPENKKGDPVLADDEGLVEWASDIRGLVALADVDDLRAKEPALRRVLTRWLAIDHRA